MKQAIILISIIIAVGAAGCRQAPATDDDGRFAELDKALAMHEEQVWHTCAKYDRLAYDLKDIKEGRARSIYHNHSRYIDTLLLDYRKRKIDSAELVYQIQLKLCSLYTEFQNDSAQAYARRNIALAREMGDSARVMDNKLTLMRLLNKCYLLDESDVLAATLDTTAMTPGQRLFYYRNRADSYLFKVEFHKGSAFEEEFQRELTRYRRLIAETAPKGSLTQEIYRANYLNDTGNTAQAIAMVENLLNNYEPGERNYSVLTSTLAFYYGEMGDSKKREELLARSAASDVYGMIMENSALRQLAQMLFKEGDIDRAYRYLNQSLYDANFYGTRLRNVQSSQLLPAITRAYEQKQETYIREKERLNRRLWLLTALLALGIVAITLLAWRYLRLSAKLYEANRSLHHTVGQLEQTNALLAERDQIKEQYLSRFLRLSSSLIEDRETRRKQLNKLAMDNRHSELAALLKSTDAYNRYTQDFYNNFDEAFLNIYPDFIQNVNALLYPHERIVPKQDERLTRELRILALMRLGIDDNKEIADILRSSISTVYTYRSRLKARAIAKETFEDNIRAL